MSWPKPPDEGRSVAVAVQVWCNTEVPSVQAWRHGRRLNLITKSKTQKLICESIQAKARDQMYSFVGTPSLEAAKSTHRPIDDRCQSSATWQQKLTNLKLMLSWQKGATCPCHLSMSIKSDYFKEINRTFSDIFWYRIPLQQNPSSLHVLIRKKARNMMQSPKNIQGPFKKKLQRLFKRFRNDSNNHGSCRRTC